MNKENIRIKCSGSTKEDCGRCGKYYSSHSSHYDKFYNRKVEEISCSIGGNRTWDAEDGRRLE